MATNNQDVAAILNAGFVLDELEWKVQTAGRSSNGIWARIVPYVTNRAIIARLDEAFGPAGYDIELEPILTGASKDGRRSGFKARITARWPEGQVTVREDVCEETDTEPMKGGASGADKRAAVLYGIGRYLYTSPDFWAVISDQGVYRGQFKDKGTNERVSFKWNLPSEALQWVQETQRVRAVPAPSTSNAPSSPAPPSPAPSRPATTAAPATPSSGSVMPGREGWFQGAAGLPMAEVPSDVLTEAGAYYRKRITEKPDDRWIEKARQDLAIIQAEIDRRGGQEDLPDEPPPFDENPFDDVDDDDLPF